MMDKVQMYSALLEDQIQGVVESRKSWTEFLTASSRFYKYPFFDQLMIYAQRPEATACAAYHIWDKKMGRYVRKGSKGIALLDNSSGTTKLNYVYDVADTGKRNDDSLTPYLWRMEEGHQQAVSDMLMRVYHCPDSLSLADQLKNVAELLAENLWDNQKDAVRRIVDKENRYDYDESTLHEAFCNAVTVSVAYTLQARCGLQPDEWFSDEDFQYVLRWNTPAATRALGGAIAQVSEEVLRRIERTIKDIDQERGYDNEHHLHAGRRLPDSRDSGEEAAADQSLQARQTVSALHGNGAAVDIQRIGHDRSMDGAHSGDRRDGEKPDGAAAAHDAGASGRNGRIESKRSYGVGGPDEYHQGTSGGNGAGRSESDADQLLSSLRNPSPFRSDQVAAARQAESVSTPSAFSMRPEMIDLVLQMSGNSKSNRMRIMLAFMQKKSLNEIADLMKNIIRGGDCYVMDGERACAWYADDGIHLTKGKTARYDPTAQVLSWYDAAARIGELIQSGEYGAVNEPYEAYPAARDDLAQSLWFVYHDLTDEAISAGWLPLLGGMMGEGIFHDSETISKALTDPAFLEYATAEFAAFRQGYVENHDLLRFHNHELQNIHQQLTDLALPRVSLPLQMYHHPKPQTYITDDELDYALSNGRLTTRQKERIATFYGESHKPVEQAEFIQKMFDGGSRSDVFPSNVRSHEDIILDRGILLSKGSCPGEFLTWAQAADRIEALILKDRFMTTEEKAEPDILPQAPTSNTPPEASAEQAPLAERFFADDEMDITEGSAAVEGGLNDGPAEQQGASEIQPSDSLHLSIPFSEHPVFYDREGNERYKDLSFALGNRLLGLLDEKQHREREIRDDIGWYNKTDFIVSAVINGEESTYEGRFDIGDGEGDLIAHIKNYYEYSASPDCPYHGAWRQKGEDYYQEKIAAVRWGLDVFVPYLEKHTELSAEDQNLLSEIMATERDWYRKGEEAEQDEMLIEQSSEAPEAETDEAASEPVPARSVEIPRPYGIGDTVFLNDKEFIIEQIGLFDVQLYAASQDKPIRQTESIALFDHMLRRDERNAIFTEYLTNYHMLSWDVLRETVLPHILSGEDWRVIGKMLDDGAGNSSIGEYLSVRFSGMAELIARENDTSVSYAATPGGIDLSVEGVDSDGLSASWSDMGGLFRSLHRDNLDGFSQPQLEAGIEADVPDLSHGADDDRRDGAGRRDTDSGTKAPKTTGEQTESAPKPVTPNGNSEWQIYTALANDQPVDVSRNDREPKGQEEIGISNYRITDDHLGEGGAKTKYRHNVEAIRTLKQIEAEGRSATREEQEILSQYVGWGGISQAFDDLAHDWQNEYAELRSLLSSQEYEMARASCINAHYTSPTVIRAMYQAVERMGFVTGNVLEPSCGVGNFFGMLPESMQGSRLYGVELDSITGRIAKLLYPKAHITVTGFENTDRKDYFDLAIGNVPFGTYQVADRQYDRHNFLIHDYFFAKSLDQVRPGGVIAFVSSKGTLDKQNPDVRRYIAQRAELLGAIRLPNNAFKANAGTSVTSDIIFLQKRERPMEVEPDWLYLGQTADGIPVNSYFANHPEMVLGHMAWDDSMHGNKKETACLPIEGADLQELLSEAIKNIGGKYTEVELPELGEGEKIRASIPADPNVKNYSYTEVDGRIYYRENSIMVEPDLNATAKERIRGLIGLRECTRALLDAQLNDYSDDAIHALQEDLNRRYDSYTAKYGLISSRANNIAFSDDSSYYLLCSLEVLNDDKQFVRKADIFTKRTIKRQQAVEHVETAAEALAVSIGERARVDMPYMMQLSGLSEEQLVRDLTGVIFQEPTFSGKDKRYVTADEYLSGNVREKLRQARRAAQRDASFQRNVQELMAAQPADLSASEIDVRLGSIWVDKEYYQQFMEELLNPPHDEKAPIEISYSDLTSEWRISNKSRPGKYDVLSRTTYGTERVSAYKILEDSLNLRDVRVYDIVVDDEGKEKRVLNAKETTIAQQKQTTIKEAFKQWIWSDPDRRQELVRKYNDKFNSIKNREYDGQHLVLTGMSPEITLREHQRGAIAHILYGGNTLLAHEVGAGKTFEMVAAAMESKRLGLCNKPMFVVPNHLTEQWATEFLRLYPSANVLVTTKRDFATHNRKKFCSRIATGDYDAIIIGHSQFERIPISRERQQALLNEQITDIVESIREIKLAHGEPVTIKQLESTKKSLEARLTKLTDTGKADDVVTFEQLGVDRLFVDEAHSFKNLLTVTKMRNVAGISTSEAQKSNDMFLKCRYLDETTGGKGVVFATGTPVSNSMTELYTMQRYLQYDDLQRQGMGHFDSWASVFGDTVTSIELAPEGTGYRARTRFAKFFNLPELMRMFKEIADIKTADQLNLPRPDAHYETIVAHPSEEQKEYVQKLSERAAAIHKGMVDPRKDNMLKITSDGRKLGLDQRLIDPTLPDHPGSKVNLCVDNICRIWQETAEERLTQLVFCDISTPKAAAANDGSTEQSISADFSVYDDVRAKLIERGIPPEEIAFIHDANSDAKKKELFSKVRSGRVRVLMGSTAKMGAGTNVQDKLIALHDLDCPWRPGDLEQRAGRIVRQGNQNPLVHIYRYVTEGTFDAYLWQTIETKQRFIAQVMSSKNPVRTCDDVDETALSYAEIKALCAGDERIREKMDLEVDMARLKVVRTEYWTQHYKLEDDLRTYYPQRLSDYEGQLKRLHQDEVTLAAHPLPVTDAITVEIGGQMMTDRTEAGKELLNACQQATANDGIRIGQYRGLTMCAHYDDFNKKFSLSLHGESVYTVELRKDASVNFQRIDTVLAGIPTHIESIEKSVKVLKQQQEAARQEYAKPFEQETEFQTKLQRLAELDAALNIDHVHGGEAAKVDDADEITRLSKPRQAKGRREEPSL